MDEQGIMGDHLGFGCLSFDEAPPDDWAVMGVIDVSWQDFVRVFGVEFVENDGRWEAPGPIAYATIRLGDGTVCPLEHHFDCFEGKVLAKAVRGTDPLAWCARLANDLGIEPDSIMLDYRSPAESRSTRRVVGDRLVFSDRKFPPGSPSARG